MPRGFFCWRLLIDAGRRGSVDAGPDALGDVMATADTEVRQGIFRCACYGVSLFAFTARRACASAVIESIRLADTHRQGIRARTCPFMARTGHGTAPVAYWGCLFPFRVLPGGAWLLPDLSSPRPLRPGLFAGLHRAPRNDIDRGTTKQNAGIPKDAGVSIKLT